VVFVVGCSRSCAGGGFVPWFVGAYRLGEDDG
jgi:hypothetical protein